MCTKVSTEKGNKVLKSQRSLKKLHDNGNIEMFRMFCDFSHGKIQIYEKKNIFMMVCNVYQENCSDILQVDQYFSRQ